MQKAAAILSCFLLVLSAHSQDEASRLKQTMRTGGTYQIRNEAALHYLSKYGTQNFDEWLMLSTEGLALARQNADAVAAGQFIRNIGEAWYFKGKYDSAALYIIESVQVLENTAAKERLALSYNALAKLYRKTRALDRAAANYEKALQIYEQLNDAAGMATIYNEYGVVFEYRGDYDAAFSRYNASLQINKKLNDSVGIAYALNNIAGVYVMQARYSPALTALHEALAIRKVLRDTFAMALTYSDLGSTANANKQYNQARTYIDSSNAIALTKGYVELLKNNFETASGIAEQQNDFQSALRLFKQRTSLHDSIYGIEKTKQIEEMSVKYETVQRQQQIQQQQFEISRKNYLLYGSALLFGLICLLSYNYYRRYKLKKEKQLQYEIINQQDIATRAVLNAEEMERQRIAQELHDGVGQLMSAAKMNLSAIENEIPFVSSNQKAAYEKSMALVDESCKEVRTVSHQMMPNALLKKGLASAIREFVEKIDSRVLKIDLYSEGLNERIDSSTETVLYRVVQECVNNVIKHSGAGHLDISLIKDADGISITIEDNGIGFDAAETDKNGIGLQNIKTRIAYLKGTVDFDSTPGQGTLVAIHVPAA